MQSSFYNDDKARPAFELIKPGMRATEVDRQVLDLIMAGGFGNGILHRTGHGFGITGHEPPWIAHGKRGHVGGEYGHQHRAGHLHPGHRWLSSFRHCSGNQEWLPQHDQCPS
ncbi:MAG: aminopeptidase P family protein [Desulfobacteraceae bacterium]|nr:MAG: aminopeptidase P family protein [Desulfobacteraceae bacterium]